MKDFLKNKIVLGILGVVLLAGIITLFLTSNKEDNSCEDLVGGSYTLIFDTNEGNSIESINVCIACSPDAYQELPEATKTGNVFVGWYYDKELSNLVEVTNTKDITTIQKKNSKGCIVGYKNITLYAKWEKALESIIPVNTIYNTTTKKKDKLDTKIQVEIDESTLVDNSNLSFIVKLLDKNNNVINDSIVISIDGIETRINSNSKFTISNSLSCGKHNLSIVYNGNDNYNGSKYEEELVVKKATNIDLTMDKMIAYREGKVNVTLTDNQNPLSNKELVLYINNNVVDKKTTNLNGEVEFTIENGAANQTKLEVKFLGDSEYKECSKVEEFVQYVETMINFDIEYENGVFTISGIVTDIKGEPCDLIEGSLQLNTIYPAKSFDLEIGKGGRFTTTLNYTIQAYESFEVHAEFIGQEQCLSSTVSQKYIYIDGSLKKSVLLMNSIENISDTQYELNINLNNEDENETPLANRAIRIIKGDDTLGTVYTNEKGEATFIGDRYDNDTTIVILFDGDDEYTNESCQKVIKGKVVKLTVARHEVEVLDDDHVKFTFYDSNDNPIVNEYFDIGIGTSLKSGLKSNDKGCVIITLSKSLEQGENEYNVILNQELSENVKYYYYSDSGIINYNYVSKEETNLRAISHLTDDTQYSYNIHATLTDSNNDNLANKTIVIEADNIVIAEKTTTDLGEVEFDYNTTEKVEEFKATFYADDDYKTSIYTF